MKKKKKRKHKRRRLVIVSFKEMRQSVIRFHQEQHIPYTMKFTNSTAYLESNQGYYMTNATDFPLSELIYIQMFKKHIMETKKYEKVKRVSKNKIRYYGYNDKIRAGSSFKECYEIDLKSAYWEIAYKMGLIEESLYRKAVDINPETGKVYMGKITRLAAVGSLAKSEEIIYFNGKKETGSKVITSRRTRHIWNNICHRVGQSMIKVAKRAGNDFVFFWVDAIFVKSNKAKRTVESLLKKDGFNFTSKAIKGIKFDSRKIWVADGKEERPFPYARKKSIVKSKK